MANLNDTTPLSLPYYQYVRLGGSALFNAKIYVGIAETDPTNTDNQIDVLAIGAGGATTVLDQPIRTNTEGYAVDDIGNIVYPVVSDDYSITVNDQNDVTIYEESTVFINPSESLVTTINTLSVTVTKGQTVINVPDLPNSVLLFIPLAQEPDVDFTYNKVTGDITLVVPFTGNEQVWVQYGAVVSITGNTVEGTKNYANMDLAISDSSLEEGDVFTTNAYHALSTGGSARYVVSTTTGSSGQLNNIPLTASGFFAQIIPQNNTISLAQAGAKFLDEGAAGFDDTALNEALIYCADNGVNLSLEGKEPHLYETHPVTNSLGAGTIGFVISGAGNSTSLRNQADVITFEFLAAHTYKNMLLKDFNLQSSGALNDTGVKIRNWFESCSMQNVFAIGHRYAFHILQSFNPSFYNCYARQAANRHAADFGNDPTPTYGWWIDGSEGAINALYFFGCSAERFWNNRFIDNTADVGNFVSLEWHGGISQSAWETGTMIKGGGAQCAFFGGYNENNWSQAQVLSGGSGVLADQGVNFTIQGIVGVDDFSIYQSGVYHQVSQNIQNNAPIGDIASVFADSNIEELNFSSINSRHGYNDPSKVDWNFYFDDGIGVLVTDINIVNSAKASNESIYVGSRYQKKTSFSLFGLDNTTDISTEPLASFSSDNATVFLSFTSKDNATFTTAPVYIIQNQAGATVGSVTFENPSTPLNVTAGEEYIAKVSMGETGVFRFARSTSAVGANPDFNVEIFKKETGFNSLVTYEE